MASIIQLHMYNKKISFISTLGWVFIAKQGCMNTNTVIVANMYNFSPILPTRELRIKGKIIFTYFTNSKKISKTSF